MLKKWTFENFLNHFGVYTKNVLGIHDNSFEPKITKCFNPLYVFIFHYRRINVLLFYLERQHYDSFLVFTESSDVIVGELKIFGWIYNV